MKISDYKAKNPEYKDKSDLEVAKDLYQKHYSKKMTEEEFLKTVGIEALKPEKKDNETVKRQEAYIEDLRERLKEATSELETTAERLKEVSAENKKLELEGASSAREVSRLEKQVVELKSDVKSRDVDLSYSRKEVSDHTNTHRQEVMALQSTIKRMESEKPKGDKSAELKATITRLQSDIRRLEGESSLKDMKIMQMDKPSVPAILKTQHKPWSGTVTVERTFNNGMAQVLRFEPEE